MVLEPVDVRKKETNIFDSVEQVGWHTYIGRWRQCRFMSSNHMKLHKF